VVEVEAKDDEALAVVPEQMRRTYELAQEVGN
jgi:urease accessory protein UreE